MNWARTGLLVLACFCLGLEQRLWASRVAPLLHHRAPISYAASASFQEQQARLEEELRKLPPDSRQFFQEMFFDARQQMLVSPVIRSMQRMTFATKDPEDGALEAQRRYQTFKKLEGVLETILWILGLSAIVWSTGVSLLGKHEIGRPMANVCLTASHAWFFAVSCLCALWAGLSLRNPWPALPVGFYLVPIAASAAAMLPDSGEENMLRAAATLEAPVVCLALSMLAAALA